MKWIQKNFKTLIYIAFVVPILTVAFVSISHVTKWYGISNPLSWAIYLSIGIEIAALSALAAISANMGRKVYFPFGMVTLIQFIGNIYFAYQFIDIGSKSFTDWVNLVDPIVSYLGVESGDLQGHKRFLAFFAGGMLPLISLSFLHMLVKFEEEDKKNKNIVEEKDIVEKEEVKIVQSGETNTEEVEIPETLTDKKEEDNYGIPDTTSNSKDDGEYGIGSLPDKNSEDIKIQESEEDTEVSENTEPKRNTLVYVK